MKILIPTLIAGLLALIPGLEAPAATLSFAPGGLPFEPSIPRQATAGAAVDGGMAVSDVSDQTFDVFNASVTAQVPPADVLPDSIAAVASAQGSSGLNSAQAFTFNAQTAAYWGFGFWGDGGQSYFEDYVPLEVDVNTPFTLTGDIEYPFGYAVVGPLSGVNFSAGDGSFSYSAPTSGPFSYSGTLLAGTTYYFQALSESDSEFGNNYTSTVEAVLQVPVPEPSALLLLVVGGTGLAVRRRRA